MSLLYDDGYHVPLPVLAKRELSPENFNPMCWHLLDPKRFVQVLVEGIGGLNWINAERSQVVQGGQSNASQT
jgi:hypothetical protein